MATFGNNEILIKIDELPEINGMAIKSIYLTSYDSRGIKDYIVSKDHAEPYYECIPYFNTVDRTKYPIIRTRKLPKELQEVFDTPQSIKYQDTKTGEITRESTINVTSMSFRTSSSGNGSFIDDSISLRGGIKYGRTDYISVTRNNKNTTHKELTGAYDRIIKVINTKGTVEVLKEHEYCYYPSTALRRVDNWNYPTPVCSGWRSGTKMPYVTLDNRKSLRVLNVELDCHVFLIKVTEEDIEIGGEYKFVQFNYRHDEEPEKYCFIKSWNSSKEGDPNGMLSYRVDKVKKSEYSEPIAECTIMGQQKRYANETVSIESLYRVVRILPIINDE